MILVSLDDPKPKPEKKERINLDELSPEQRQFLAEGCDLVFKQVLEENVSLRQMLENKYGIGRLDPSRASNSTKFLRGLGLVLRRILGNTFLSFIFGIDPVFLDNDVQKDPEQLEKACMRCKLRVLCYSCLVDQEKGLKKISEYLNSSEPDRVLRMLKDIQRWDEVLDSHESYPVVNYDGLIAMLLTAKENNVRLLSAELYTKNYIMHFERGTSLGYSYDFRAALKKLWEEYRVRWKVPEGETK